MQRAQLHGRLQQPWVAAAARAARMDVRMVACMCACIFRGRTWPVYQCINCLR